MSKIDEILKILPSRLIFDDDNIPEYSFIQHIPEDVEIAQSEFLQYCVSEGVLPSSFLKGDVHRQGIVGRYLDDCGKIHISNVWYRFMCIDDMYREWQQPYFAINYGKLCNVQPCYSLNSNPILVQFYRDRNINRVLK